MIVKDPSIHPDAAAERRRHEMHSPVADEGFLRILEGFLAENVDPYVKPGTALDYGCGRTGALLGLLEKRGYEAVGYDPLFFPDPAPLLRRYGLVTATEVVEHFRDPFAEWEKMASLPAPGGVLAVSTRMVPADFERWWYRRDETHLCFYTPVALALLGRRFGLSVLATDARAAIVFRRDRLVRADPFFMRFRGENRKTLT